MRCLCCGDSDSDRPFCGVCRERCIARVFHNVIKCEITPNNEPIYTNLLLNLMSRGRK